MTQGIGRSLPPLSGIQPGAGAESIPRPDGGAGSFEATFNEVLASKAAVRFSKHAEERMRARGIQLSPLDLAKLGQAFNEAEARGARDSLVLTGSVAYVVNVPSRTVVTALQGGETRGHVFTNIDSAVVI